jgi:AAA+ superfamily predicted ATPase
MSLSASDYELVRNDIYDFIERTAHQKWTIKIKTLMSTFGYTATQRVRQSSLRTVLDTLHDWGIDYYLPGGTSANDRITLSYAVAPVLPDTAPDLRLAETKLETHAFDAGSPLPFLFLVGDTLTEARSRASARDLMSAIWSFHPVCMLVEANDEFYTFACGFVAALMRRRARMLRSGDGIHLAPTLITVDDLRIALGQTPTPGWRDPFPTTGAVYILRDDPHDVEDDDLIALARESLLPHTYRLKSRFSATQGERVPGSRASDSPDFAQMLQWMAAFAGTLHLTLPTGDHTIDLASLLAEAAHLRDTLLTRQSLHPIDPDFRAGFESTEHMVLKSVLLNGLRRRFPNEPLAVEEVITNDDDAWYATDNPSERTRRNKPDLRVGNHLWVEVETLRGLLRHGSSPFLALESKLRQKLDGMRHAQEVWLIVPSDVALLGHDHMSALVRNLNTALGQDSIRYGFVDMVTETPIFLEVAPPQPAEARLVGTPWRNRSTVTTQPLTWNDIAGYSDVKDLIRQDILDPLLEPDRYAQYGLNAANGLLLYGLPGCGKSLIGRVLAAEADLTCRLVLPSDITSMWLGEGVMKIRALFDWALKQAPSMLVLDELDAVAPQRQEHNMHTSEKRQVNELLVQLDRVAGQGVVIVATTNYVRGIDSAIQRSGRFDLKLPIFPPDAADRQVIFTYYLGTLRDTGFAAIDAIDTARLAAEALLYTPADIKAVVQTAARRNVRASSTEQPPHLTTDAIRQAMHQHTRSIKHDMGRAWFKEAFVDNKHHPRLRWLHEEIGRVFGTAKQG